MDTDSNRRGNNRQNFDRNDSKDRPDKTLEETIVVTEVLSIAERACNWIVHKINKIVHTKKKHQ